MSDPLVSAVAFDRCLNPSQLSAAVCRDVVANQLSVAVHNAGKANPRTVEIVIFALKSNIASSPDCFRNARNLKLEVDRPMVQHLSGEPVHIDAVFAQVERHTAARPVVAHLIEEETDGNSGGSASVAVNHGSQTFRNLC